MGRTPDELGRALTSAEWSELLASWLIDPFPDEWLIGATAAAAAFNAWGGKAAPDDFIPRAPGDKPEPLSAERSAGVFGRMTRGEAP